MGVTEGLWIRRELEGEAVVGLAPGSAKIDGTSVKRHDLYCSLHFGNV